MQKKPVGQHQKSIKNQLLTPKTWPFGQHRENDLVAVAEAEVDGVGMGVFGDGTPYLTLRGLSRLCGADPASIQRMASQWGDEQNRPRGKRIAALLREQGHPGDFLYVRINGIGGENHAFPDAVCMAILEYYAFDAKTPAAEIAQTNYRLMARQSLRKYIYDQCGYQPGEVIDQWRQFHDRLSMVHNAVPAGYFGVFHAIADMFVSLGENGLFTDNTFIPDGSVGKLWSTHWKAIDGDSRYGERIHYPHSFPTYFPQSASNPQDAWAYPESALGEFHRWRREEYVAKGAFLKYLTKKERERALPVGFAQKAVVALQAPYRAAVMRP